MTVVSAQRRGSLLGVVDRFWRKSGYRMTAINNDVDVPAIYARTEDGFQVGLIVADEGQVHFDVLSPCVTYSEVADSPARPPRPSTRRRRSSLAPTSTPTSGPHRRRRLV